MKAIVPKEFNFVGAIPASKSLMNRSLIIQSYFPMIKLEGDSSCEDVALMKQGLKDLMSGRAMQAGHAGTVLRFLALRCSRISGTHEIQGSERLFSRPQKELISVLMQLGVKAELFKNKIVIESEGWKPQGDAVHVPVSKSSQFLSALLLNAWELPFDLYISPNGKIKSETYFEMTMDWLSDAGMEISLSEEGFIIKGGQTASVTELAVEPDMSSAFSLAAIAAVKGKFLLTNFKDSDLQPDQVFLNVLEHMGAIVENGKKGLRISRNGNLSPIKFNVDLAPDLFPVLAVLCSSITGRSELYGGSQLKFKESNRLEKIAELLAKMGKTFELEEDGIVINGNSTVTPTPIDFDCDQDHRLAMAVGLANYLGFDIRISEPGVVDKSFPEYWDCSGVRWSH